MHFDSKAFSRNKKDTLGSKNIRVKAGAFQFYTQPDELDFLHINLLYCNGKVYAQLYIHLNKLYTGH